MLGIITLFDKRKELNGIDIKTRWWESKGKFCVLRATKQTGRKDWTNFFGENAILKTFKHFLKRFAFCLMKYAHIQS